MDSAELSESIQSPAKPRLAKTTKMNNYERVNYILSDHHARMRDHLHGSFHILAAVGVHPLLIRYCTRIVALCFR